MCSESVNQNQTEEEPSNEMMEDITALSCGQDLLFTETFELDFEMLKQKPLFPSMG